MTCLEHRPSAGYDRFIFGQCPTGFQYDYLPFQGGCVLNAGTGAAPVSIDSEVWEAKSAWRKENHANARVIEHGLRAAVICASMDGRRLLKPQDLDPVWAFVKYQEKLRKTLQPNAGVTSDAKLAYKFLAYLDRHAPSGEWLNVRQMFRATNASDLGPTAANRALQALSMNGEVEALEGNQGKRNSRTGATCGLMSKQVTVGGLEIDCQWLM